MRQLLLQGGQHVALAKGLPNRELSLKGWQSFPYN